VGGLYILWGKAAHLLQGKAAFESQEGEVEKTQTDRNVRHKKCGTGANGSGPSCQTEIRALQCEKLNLAA
jgi:hypothetical protein